MLLYGAAVQEGMEHKELAHFQHPILAACLGNVSDYIPSLGSTQCRLIDITDQY